MNGFRDKDMSQPDKIEQIELVLEDFGRMNCISAFKNIKKLTLINVGISSIEVPLLINSLQGLEECVKLEELCLNENSIVSLAGLSKCTNLRNLYISHNQISSTAGLQTLNRLETLWLCDNKIDVRIHDNFTISSHSNISRTCSIWNNYGLPEIILIPSGLLLTNWNPSRI